MVLPSRETRAAVLRLADTMRPAPENAGKGLERDQRLGALELREDDPSPACAAHRGYLSEGEDVEDGSPRHAEYERRLCEQSSSPMRLQELSTGSDDETESQEQLAESPAATQEQAASLSRRSSVESTSTHIEGVSWGKVVVSRFPEFQVQSADMRWLRLFGFSASDVKKRTLRIATGPKTKMQVLSQLCLALSRTKPSPLEFVTMYKKSGEELCVMARATVEPGKEGHIALEMRSLDVVTIPEEDFDEEAAVHLSSEAPHTVSRANALCEALLGVTESRLKERGLADMFTAQTSRTCWKKLIQGAAEGATRSCPMSLRGSNDQELNVVMEVSPDTGIKRVASLYPHVVVHLRLSLAASSPGSAASDAFSPFACEEAGAPSSNPTWELAGEAFALSTSPQGSFCAVSSASGEGGSIARAPSEGAMGNEGNAHLRAFKEARRRKRKEEKAMRDSDGGWSFSSIESSQGWSASSW